MRRRRGIHHLASTRDWACGMRSSRNMYYFVTNLRVL